MTIRARHAAALVMLAAACGAEPQAPEEPTGNRPAVHLTERGHQLGVRHRIEGTALHDCVFATGEENVSNRADHQVCLESRILVGGVAAADLHGDGYPDLLFTRPHGHPILYRNENGQTFRDVSEEWGLTGINASTSGAAFADLDGDGLLDLVLGTVGHDRNIVMKNIGGTFEEWRGTGIDIQSSIPTSSSSVLAEDLTGNGLVDIIITRWYGPERWPTVPAQGHQPDSILINGKNGQPGSFSAVPLPRAELDAAADTRHRSFGLPAGTTPAADFGAALIDLEGDGEKKLVIAGDWGTSRTVRILTGTDGATKAETFEGPDLTGAYLAMGIAVGDVTGNGNADLFVTAVRNAGRNCAGRPCTIRTFGANSTYGDGNLLIEGGGDGRNIARTLGVEDGGWGWGAGIADLNGDGTPEIIMTNGYDPYGDELPSSAFGFRNDKDRLWTEREGHYTDIADISGFGSDEEGRAVLILDLNLNGSPDIIVTRATGRPHIYLNRSRETESESLAAWRAQPEEGSFFLSNMAR